jgi:glycosidase
MLFPGSPAIYYGDEAGMRGKTDPDCRRCMIWEDENRELGDWYRQLISLRKGRRSLRGGSFRANYCDGKVYGFIRRLDGEKAIYVILNVGPARNIVLPVTETGTYTELFSDRLYHTSSLEPGTPCYNADLLNYTGVLTLAVPEWGVMIVEQAENTMRCMDVL